jgi:CheY-like chemotaxis protein
VSDPEHGNLAGLRVLVADDEVMVAMLLKGMLTALDAEVVGPVNSTETALRAIEEEALDAATLDVNMRGSRIYKAAAALRQRGIPFIFVTGYGDLSDCPESLRDVPRLTKPFRLKDLAAALEGVIGQA